MSDFISNINSNYIGGDILDGQWVVLPDPIVLFVGDWTDYKSSGSVHIASLEDILPNDDYTYLCQIRLHAGTGTKSGNVFTTLVISGSVNYKYTGNNSCWHSGLPFTSAQGVRTRTSNSRICAGWMFIPVYPQDRNITLINANQANNTNFPSGATLYRFRRLGTNK